MEIIIKHTKISFVNLSTEMELYLIRKTQPESLQIV